MRYLAFQHIALYDRALWAILKKIDEDELMQFDDYYYRIIKKKRCK